MEYSEEVIEQAIESPLPQVTAKTRPHHKSLPIKSSKKDFYENEKEYAQSIANQKITEMMSQPFINSINNHKTGITAMSIIKETPNILVTGDYEGSICLSNLQTASRINSFNITQAKILKIREYDRVVYVNNSNGCLLASTINEDLSISSKPVTFNIDTVNDFELINKDTMLHCFDNKLGLYSLSTNSYSSYVKFHGVESNEDILKCAFNPSMNNIIVCIGSKGSIFLVDTRQKELIEKVKPSPNFATNLGKHKKDQYLSSISSRFNSVQINPVYTHDFLLAGEDSNLYTFDMRKLNKPKIKHSGHVKSVMDGSFDSLGTSIVSAGYDSTVRVFGRFDHRSENVLFTKRMTNVNKVIFSNDDRFVISGSEDGNTRIWKRNINEKLNSMNYKEIKSKKNKDKLYKKYKNEGDIKNVNGNYKLPKFLKTANKQNIEKIKRNKYK
eukprot:GAHX01002175.1.p1 GENE.GAHX01002175.1~~GAHX01002175.1.p1  ORF type:complete len:442 (+),score=62.22 GAHX01002175.1:38-1363(+)